jgi:hypothetical protein
MSTHRRDASLYVKALELTCRSEKLRREMLWLRAMEKQNRDAARDLERADPDLRSRVADVTARAEGLEPTAASEVYGTAQDERMEAVLAIVEREARHRGAR